MKILIVDDYPDLLEVLAYTLAKAGHTVETACDGVQGLAAFDRDSQAAITNEGPNGIVPFDAVISDWNMPRMNGFLMVTEILKLDPRVKIVMMSGDWTNQPPHRDPPIRLLSKPFDMGCLLDELAKDS